MPLPKSYPLHSAPRATPSSIPAIGFGTFQSDPKTPPGTVKAAVLEALRVGYRHFDVGLAYGFGKVERELGEALSECRIPREELFIVTKLHMTFHNPEDVEVGLDWSLRNLGLEYVPHAYKHVPRTYETVRYPTGKPVIDYDLSRRYTDTWKAMEALVQKGKTRHIGLSNFNILKTKRILEVATIHPVVNQVEIHPYLPQRKLLEFCTTNNIHVTAHSPLGGAPVAVVSSGKPGPMEDAKIISLAEKHSIPKAKLLLSWALMRGVSIIPKSNHPERIRCNFELPVLPQELFLAIDSIREGDQVEPGDRRNDAKNHVGFDIYDEEVDEPTPARG